MAVSTKMFISDVAAKPNNLIIGCHVTITSNFECPTEYNKSGGTEQAQESVLQCQQVHTVRHE